MHSAAGRSPQARRPPLHPALTVRQIAADYFGCREVLRRHGEPERDQARFGHLEPLAGFARRQGLALEPLLAELAQATGVEARRDDPAARPAHRSFVAAALAVTLILGAGWGTWLLTDIGRRGSLTAVPAAPIVAHGTAQLWGFMALFVVGIATSYLPMVTGRPRPHRLRRGRLLAAMLAGVLG